MTAVIDRDESDERSAAVPPNVQSIVEVLRYRAATHGTRVAFRLLDERGQESESITFAQLLSRSLAVAQLLARTCQPQDRVLLMLPTSAQFLYALFGCMLARLVSVPLPIPKLTRAESAFAAVIADCAPRQILCTAAVQSLLSSDVSLARIMGSVVFMLVDDALAAEANEPRLVREFPPPDGADVALLQYTSGSTSRPKGVVVRHANIIANQRMIQEGFDHRHAITVVAWAPLFHDQGLIGNVLQPLFIGGCSVLLPPAAFFKDPLLWLELIHRYRAHTSGGPNFAFASCVQRYNAERASALDLSCWKIAFNGAEPIAAQVLRDFTRRYEAHGFSSKAHFPCYGLAEATLYVSGGPAHRETEVLSLAAMGVATHRVDVANRQNGDCEVVRSGAVHRDVEVFIADEREQRCVPGEIGEICLRGPSIASGYWALPAESAPHFSALDEGRPYLKTGDLGFLHDGALYITGRKKELIILRGRNVYPYDIERSITACHEGFRSGHCAVFGSNDGGYERVHAVQEVERTFRRKIDFSEIAGVVRKRVAQQHGVMLYRIHFVKPGYIPKTSSGKTKRVLLPSLLADRSTPNEHVYATC
jgi:acyl-CoA synthetase (AMP-forming)/AMP-acid ligase II